MDYITDGVHLYEVAARRTVQNAGCYWRSGGRHDRVMRYVVLRDTVSESCCTVDDVDLVAYRTVAPAVSDSVPKAA